VGQYLVDAEVIDSAETSTLKLALLSVRREIKTWRKILHEDVKW
jgi:hypothetical protein